MSDDESTLAFASKLQIPRLPNFILLEGEFGGDAPKIDVKSLSDERLREIGRAWTEALIEHARTRREADRPSPFYSPFERQWR